MHKDIIPFTPKGELTPPISKSYCHRYLIAAFCAGVEIDPSKVNFCDDVIYTYMGLNLLKSIFESKSNLKTIKINVGQSASTLRMLLLVATYICDEVIFVGDSTLFARPLKPFLGILERQKIEYELGDDYLMVKGKISIEDFDIDGSVSSQFISGLLFLSAFAKSRNRITVIGDSVSKNYIKMTLQELEAFGFRFSINQNTYQFESFDKPNEIIPVLESDYSAISNFAVLAALCGDITINNVSEETRQSDSYIFDILSSCGAKIDWYENKVRISRSEISPFEVDIKNCIDLGPILFMLAASIKGTSIIKGYENLRYKETNRLDNVINQLKAYGANVVEEDNALYITGREYLFKSFEFDSFKDHRLAMAFTIFAIANEINAEIEDYECVSKSYPNFYIDLETLK